MQSCSCSRSGYGAAFSALAQRGHFLGEPGKIDSPLFGFFKVNQKERHHFLDLKKDTPICLSMETDLVSGKNLTFRDIQRIVMLLICTQLFVRRAWLRQCLVFKVLLGNSLGFVKTPTFPLEVYGLFPVLLFIEIMPAQHCLKYWTCPNRRFVRVNPTHGKLAQSPWTTLLLVWKRYT